MDSDKAGESELLDELLGLEPRGYDEDDDERTRVFASDPPAADPEPSPSPANSKTSPARPAKPPAPSRAKAPPPPPPRVSSKPSVAPPPVAERALVKQVEQAFDEEGAEVIEDAEASAELSDDAATHVVPEVRPVDAAALEGPFSTPGPHDPLLGVVVDGRYRVESVLGVGGIGLVYLCQHEVLEKPVAMKILRREYVAHEDLNERFLNEARASSAIKSPHIVDTIDVGTLPNGTPYFVMEYVDGETLAALLDREGAIALERSVEIARQIAEGLEAAHAAGVIHRDLKPENVFLAPGEVPGVPFVKIFDFGIAKVARARKRLTYAGAVFGTPHYMSPEQARGESVDTPSDLYALGVMLFEMITGTVPFDGDDPLAVMSQHVDRVPPLLAAVRGAPVPASLEAIVARCLAKDPRDRYASASDLVADIARLDPTELRTQTPSAVSNVSISAPVRAALDSAAKVQPIRAETLHAHVVSQSRPPKTRKTRFIAGALLAAAAAGGAYWLGISERSTTASMSSAPAAAPADERDTLSPPRHSLPGAPDTTREVHFVLSPIDAHLFHDDKDLGPMPVSINVKKGAPLTLTVRRKGYSTRRVVVDGSETRVVIGLVPLQPQAAKPKAKSSSSRRRSN